MVKLPVELPSKSALSSHPTNTRIIEITPSLRASDSGQQVCAHLLLFHNTYHVMKSTYISCVILNVALCSPPIP